MRSVQSTDNAPRLSPTATTTLHFVAEPLLLSMRTVWDLFAPGTPTMYDDHYATCQRTYATLCIYSGDADPSVVTKRLGIEPSSSQRRVDAEALESAKSKRAAVNGWFLESQGLVESRDSRRHIDWLLDRVEAKADALRSLQELGCRTEISCFWMSQEGHGGPALTPIQMQRLAQLNLELWFDFYGP